MEMSRRVVLVVLLRKKIIFRKKTIVGYSWTEKFTEMQKYLGML